MSPIPVIIDTDVALDDYMAILYLLLNPAVKVIGITTTGVGAAHLTPGTQNVLTLLELANQTGIPVAPGTSAPLSFSNVFPSAWRTMVDDLYYIPLGPSSNSAQQPGSAVQFLYDTLTNYGSPVTILSIGGGTNLGTLFQTYNNVTWTQYISRIFMMGGAITAPGNVNAFNPDYNNTVAEWNIFIDPVGANTVLQSGVPVTLVPLDASNQVQLDSFFYATLMGMVASPLGSSVQNLVTTFVFAGLSTQLESITQPAGSLDGYYLWDPLAAIALTDTNNQIVTTTPMQLSVSLTLNEEQDTSGQISQATSGPYIDVVTIVQTGPALVALLGTWTGYSADAITARLRSPPALRPRSRGAAHP